MGWWIFCGTYRSVQVEVEVKMLVERKLLFWVNIIVFWVNVCYRVLRSIDVDTVVMGNICRILSDILLFINDVILLYLKWGNKIEILGMAIL